MPLLTIRDISKRIDLLQILEPISFEIQESSIHSVLGKNGAGKTTLLKTIAGLYGPSSGTLQFSGRPPLASHVDTDHCHALTYFVPDTIGFSRFERFTEIHKLHEFLYPQWDEIKFQQMIKTLKFDTKKPLHRLSKGEERQLIMSFALASNPKLYILDEPFDGLDPQVHSHFSKWLIDDVITRGASVLISTHHLRDIADFCDTVTLLHRGVLKYSGELDAVLDSLWVVQCTNEMGALSKMLSFDTTPLSPQTLLSPQTPLSHKPPWSVLESHEERDYISIVTEKSNLKALLHGLDTLALENVMASDQTPEKLYFDIAPITLEQLFMHCAKEL